jgi:hypothetical protein
MTLVPMLLFIEFLSLHHNSRSAAKDAKKKIEIEFEFDTWLKLHGRK